MQHAIRTEVGARRLRRPAEVLQIERPRSEEAMPLAEINGAQLDVRERGSGEAVIFVHGAMGDQCAAIVKEPVLINNFRVIDYNRRGWGNSSIPAMPVTMQQQIADCKAILNAWTSSEPTLRASPEVARWSCKWLRTHRKSFTPWPSWNPRCLM